MSEDKKPDNIDAHFEEDSPIESDVSTDVSTEELTENISTDVSETKDTEDEKVVEEEIIEMVEIPKKRLEDLEIVEARVLEELKLEQANSINYRKRLEKQRDDFIEIASARVLTKLLAVKDDLDRIVENGKDDIPETHYQGIIMLQQRTESIFEQEKVTLMKIIPGKTKYDPKFHEAIVAQPSEDVPPNTIIDVVSVGFVKGDRVLRASKVVISKSLEKEEIKEEDFVEF